MVDREFGWFWGWDVFYLYRGCFEPLCRWLIRSLGGFGQAGTNQFGHNGPIWPVWPTRISFLWARSLFYWVNPLFYWAIGPLAPGFVPAWFKRIWEAYVSLTSKS